MRILCGKAARCHTLEIRTELESTTDWKKSNIQTLLRRLRDKRVINANHHYVTLYSTNINQEEYVKSEGQTFIDKLFGGSAKKSRGVFVPERTIGRERY